MPSRRRLAVKIRIGDVCRCPAAPRRGPRAAPHEHGCWGRYQGLAPFGGCRCEPCRATYSALLDYVPATPRPCFCKIAPPYQYRGRRLHEHGCWGRYHSVDRCRCRRCTRAYTQYQKTGPIRPGLIPEPPDWVVVYRLTRGFRVKARPCERLQAVAELRERGYSESAIADRIGTTTRTVCRIVARLADREAAAA